MQKNGNGGHDSWTPPILSGQQMRVLEFAMAGVTKPSDIALHMGITTKAVRSYMKRALAIVGAKNLEDALKTFKAPPVVPKESEFIPLDMQRTITRPPDHFHQSTGK